MRRELRVIENEQRRILGVRTIAEGINLSLRRRLVVDQKTARSKIVQIAGRSVRNYAYESETPVTVKNYRHVMDMSTLTSGCLPDDTISNCVDGETEKHGLQISVS